MREVSASEASRNFSAVLDEAEHGETIAVTRSGRRVALITPAPRANGAAIKEVFRRFSENSGIDEEFARVVADIRNNAVQKLDVDPWQD